MDNLSPEQRSKTMAAVKSEGTKLERSFFEPLLERNVGSVEFHVEDLPGKPDIVNRQSKIAIFIDSCFWHGCPEHLRMPESNREYWKKKISRNKKRDHKVTKQLENKDWLVKRIWEHSIKKDRARKWWLSRIETLISKRSASQ